MPRPRIVTKKKFKTRIYCPKCRGFIETNLILEGTHNMIYQIGSILFDISVNGETIRQIDRDSAEISYFETMLGNLQKFNIIIKEKEDDQDYNKKEKMTVLIRRYQLTYDKPPKTQ